MQRAIVDAHMTGVIDISPPVLSRAFQELSRGMVNLASLRKMKEIPFPFPYAQMIQVMLMIHTLVTPILASHLVSNRMGAVLITLAVTSSLWSCLYIAREVDQPFGEDENDLNVAEMQQLVNESLLTLLHPVAQKPPAVTSHDLRLVQSDATMEGSSSRKILGRKETNISGLIRSSTC